MEASAAKESPAAPPPAIARRLARASLICGLAAFLIPVVTTFISLLFSFYPLYILGLRACLILALIAFVTGAAAIIKRRRAGCPFRTVLAPATGLLLGAAVFTLIMLAMTRSSVQTIEF